MIRYFALCSATKLDDNRVCLSGIDTDKFFPVICFAKLEDLQDDLKNYLSDSLSNTKRCSLVNISHYDDHDLYGCIEFRFCLSYVFYKCKDGKFRSYLR